MPDAPSFPYEVDRDERYRFRFFEAELLRALGRLTLNASYLEGVLRTMLARLLDNSDLELGERVAADANFRWLVDHVRVLSEHRLPADLHARMVTWLKDAEKAYVARNRIVHSDHATNVDTGRAEMRLVWTRASARGASFATEVKPADSAEVHRVAQALERVGLDGVDLMSPVQAVLGRPE
jgi:hypothetical protein